MALGVVDVVEVHAEHDVGIRAVLALHRCGQDDLACTRLEVPLGVLAATESARALEDDIDAELGPRQPTGVRGGQRTHPAVADDDRVLVEVDGCGEPPVDRVPREQASGLGRLDDVVDSDDLDVDRAQVGGSHDAAADAAEPVDRDACGHDEFSRIGGGVRACRLVARRRCVIRDRSAHRAEDY